ncbi:hypothetical protein GGF45_001772 [Coemansia sp. RSA 551]|nr:hypothetical protein GGF45_001772 [Coemansia sp. RSA 551]
MAIVPTLVRVPGAGVIHDVTADLHSTVSNGSNNLTRMLTEKSVVIVKITTTVDVLPSMPTQASVPSAAFALPIVPSRTLPANPPPSIFVYTPPLALAALTQISTLASIRVPASVAPSIASKSDRAVTSTMPGSVAKFAEQTPTSHRQTTHADPTAPGIEKSNNSKGAFIHKQMPNRLSDRFVMLISIAVMVVSAILLYFYVRRRKQARDRRRVVVSGRSILSLSSSNLGPPSNNVEDEDKCFSSEQQPETHMLPSDSGASVGYHTVASTLAKRMQGVSYPTAMTLEKQATPQMPGVAEEDTDGARSLNINYLGYRTYGITSTVSSDMGNRAGHTTVRSDIFDCVTSDKRQAARLHMEYPQTIAEKCLKILAPQVVAKRGAKSFDHTKLQPLPSVPTGSKTSLEARKDYSTEYIYAGAKTANTGLLCEPAPATAMFDSGCLLLDTTSANPGINTTDSKSNRLLSAKLKPRKLTRDLAKRPHSGNQDREHVNSAGTKSKFVANQSIDDNGQHTSPDSSQLLQREPEHLVHLETHNQLPLGSPPHTHNFISLVDSIESLSESYKFAARHKPALGPLQVVEAHIPALPDELRLQRGEEIYVVGEFADGWMLAINVSRGNECGMIPRCCLFLPNTPFVSTNYNMEAITPPDDVSPAFSS